jgi:DNA-directed RNA polymerase subunit N (RpoN/RPB10)
MLYQMALYELPMLECSSCGQHLGHLYKDFYTLTKQLKNELEYSGRPTGSYITKANNDNITEFVRTYYDWYKQQEGADVPVHEPSNIVARALLRTQELDSAHLPFGSNVQDDGQLSTHEARICCLRMLQTDPMMTKI